MTTIISVVNQKGGVAKSTTCVNLGVGLANSGKKVLVVDCDPQGSLTASLGYRQQDELDITLADLIGGVLIDKEIDARTAILHHKENIDLIPANIELSGIDMSLVNAMSRESALRQCLDEIKNEYDYILIDCTPSLGMLTINALVAADSIIIPVQAQYLSLKGLEQLLQTIARTKKKLNPYLKIYGILITMVDSRTNYAKDVISLLNKAYGEDIHIFKNYIPLSVRAAETSAEGISIFSHDPNGKAAKSYYTLTNEVLAYEKEWS